jgi:hypothetical protein
MKLFHRHRWATFEEITGRGCIPVKRRCQKCGKKQINIWGHWFTVKNLRDLELYEVL